MKNSEFSKSMKFFHIAILFFAVGFAVYGNTLSHPFVHDDVVFIEKNPLIQDWSHVPKVFLQPIVREGAVNIVNTYYRPLLEVVYKIQYHFFQGNPFGYHFTNVTLHILNGILAYVLLFFLLSDKTLSFWTSLVFLIHPAQTEAVACISGISNILLAFFCLLSLILYFRTKKESGKTGGFAYLASLVIFLAALFTKEQAVILPFLIVLSELFFFTPREKRMFAVGSHLWPFFLIMFGYFLWRKIILGVFSPTMDVASHEFWLRILSIPQTLLAYLQITAFPIHLHYYRCVDTLAPLFLPMVYFVFFIGVVILVSRFLPDEERRIAIFGVSWFLIAILPMLNLVPLIVEYSFIMTAEHFLYFALLGLLLSGLVIARYFCLRIRPYYGQRFRIAVRLCVVSLLMLLSMKQNMYWRGEIPLFERALLFEKRLGRVHILLARAYYFHGEKDRAVRAYLEALKIMEGYANKVPEGKARKFYLGLVKEIHFDLAHCYEAKGNFQEALEEYQKALKISPRDAAIYNNLGTVHLQLNNVEEAKQYFQEALLINPRDVMALNNLALCSIRQGNLAEAEKLFRQVLTIDKNFSSAKYNLEKLRKEKLLP